MNTGTIKSHWRYLRHVGEGEPVSIGGENVWDRDWIPTGELASVIDPQHGATRRFEVWKIQQVGRPDIVFAAGEFSNGIWGFYVPADA